MSAPVKKCEVTPLEALQRLIGAASVIDANECKDEVAYNVLQSELAVAKEVAKVLAAAPEACPDPGACDRSGCCNPGGRCEEAAPVVPVAAQPNYSNNSSSSNSVEFDGIKTQTALQVPGLPTMAIAEFWSSANPDRKVRMLAEGDVEIEAWGKRSDFVRWIYLSAPSLEAQPAGEVIPAEKLCALLPGTYYMDPPDGGSVTVLGQVERMAKDAARYQWLCKTAFDSSMTQEQINKEVDASMAQGEKQ